MPVCYNDLTINNVMNLNANISYNTCYYNWTDDHKNTCPCCRNNLYKGIEERLRQLKFKLPG